MAKKEEKEVIVTPMGTTAPLTANQVADGMSDFGIADIQVPFLRIIQQLSPQLDVTRAEYIEAAKVGLIVNTLTSDLFGECELIPVVYQRRYLEWKPREMGGGLIATYDATNIPEDARPNDKGGGLIRPNGHEIRTNASYYCLMVPGMDQVILAMSKTQIKVSRRWNGTMMALRRTDEQGVKYTPPIYGTVWTMTVRQEQNAQGKWYGWNPIIKRQTTHDEMEVASYFRQRILAGAVTPQVTVTDDPEDHISDIL